MVQHLWLVMDVDDIILKVVRLPETLRHEPSQSISSLLKASGYLEIHGDIDKPKILKVVRAHPEYVASWLQWSDDIRSSPNPYFMQPDDGRAIVGFYPGNYFKVYSDICEACAVFIKLQLETIRIGSGDLNLDVLKQ